MPSFGEKLKIEREKRKLTLDDIAATTKISTRMLHALEEDKFSQLPGGIFNKGFVRAYARTVGLDEDQTIADYLEASGEAPPPRSEPVLREMQRENARDSSRENARDNAHNPAHDNSSHSSPLRITDEPSGRLEIRAEVASRQLPWGVFAVVLLIIALTLSLWTNRRREQERLATHPPRSEQSEQSRSAAETAVPPNSSAPTTDSSSANPASANQAEGSSSARSASDGRPAPDASTDKPAQPQSPQSAATLAPGEFTVTVRARDESWLSISIDGKHTGSEVLESGDERTFRARSDVLVKIGNSAAVDLLLNGKRLAFAGETDVVKTITVGPSGIVPNAPTPPSQ